jgi:hypothetical protein
MLPYLHLRRYAVAETNYLLSNACNWGTKTKQSNTSMSLPNKKCECKGGLSLFSCTSSKGSRSRIEFGMAGQNMCTKLVSVTHATDLSWRDGKKPSNLETVWGYAHLPMRTRVGMKRYFDAILLRNCVCLCLKVKHDQTNYTGKGPQTVSGGSKYKQQ